MPGNRKQKHKATFAKPSNSAYVHPSLSSTPSSAGPSTPSPSTVNERIQYLRRTQSPRHALTSADILESTHTHSPPGLAASRHARPLPFHLNRGVAGPPPPRSWIEDHDDPNVRYGEITEAERRYPSRVDYFPGIELPAVDSLLHQGLKALAQHLDWHLEYDHVYLSVLPVSMKALLFSYIARYGPKDGISYKALKTICSVESETELPDSTGSEELHRLDLAGSLGRALTFKQLTKFWTSRPPSIAQSSSTTNSSELDVPETWDDVVEQITPSLSTMSISSSLRHPLLTHLSLSHPDQSISWNDFLSFTPNLTNLTHLSLAYWPSPATSTALQQNSTDLRPSTIDVDGTATGVYRLWRLSKTTSSLTYLDLRGCHAWFYLLMCTTSATTPANPTAPTSRLITADPPRRARNRIDFDADTPQSSATRDRRTREGKDITVGADWASAWRGISFLDLSQDYLPGGLSPSILSSLYISRGRTGNYTYPALTSDAPSLARQNTQFIPDQNTEQGTRRTAERRHMEEEGYRIIAPNAQVGQQMAERKRGRRWVEGEIEGTRLERWVRGQRKEGSGRGKRGDVLRVEFGWDKERLVACGYDEQALFDAGLWL